MIYRTLGRTDLVVPVMGMGTGGHNQLGQNAGVPEADIHRLLHEVFDLGIHYFDTSPGYGESELILGRALRHLPRDRLVVSTKVALADDEGAPFSGSEVVASVEASLQRLQFDFIDLLLVTTRYPQALEAAVGEHLPALGKLLEQGKIRFIGSSEVTRSDDDHEWLRAFLPTGLADAAMVGHNMLNQSAEGWVLPYCIEQEIGTINVFTVRNVFSDRNRLGQVVAELRADGLLAEGLPGQPFDHLLADGGIQSLPEAAYRYAAFTEGITTVMCGSIRLEHIQRNIASLEKGPLPTDRIAWLRRSFGHIARAIGN